MYKSCVIALLAGVGTTMSVGAAGDVPRRDPGVWEIKTVLVDRGGLGMTAQTCVDDSVEELFVQSDEDAHCTDRVYRREGQRVIFQATCQVEGSTARLSGVFSGDFRRSYRGEIKTTYSPPIEGMASATMTMEARWLGACKPGQRPGDVLMMGVPGMGEINIEQLMKDIPNAPRR